MQRKRLFGSSFSMPPSSAGPAPPVAVSVRDSVRIAPGVLAVVLALGGGCSSSNSPTQPTPTPPPVISAVSASAVRPGDVITLHGSRFSAVPDRNRIVFNSNLAMTIPDIAASDSLVVTVPAYANSGPMYVSTDGRNSAPVTIVVQRAIGDMWVIGGAQTFEFKLEASSGSEEYLVIPYASAAGFGADYGYTVTPDTTSVYPLDRTPETQRVRGRGPRSRAIEFENWRRQTTRNTAPEGAGLRSRTPAMTGAAGNGSLRDFLVLNCVDPGCDLSLAANYVTVTAELKVTGTHVFVYADTMQPPGSYLQADYDNFAATFDTQIYPSDTLNFAPPTDIDSNGRIIVVFTPQVNRLTPPGEIDNGVITGFFHFNDIAPTLYPGTSNGGEILYMFVPDPTGETGNIFEKSRVDSFVTPVAAHELEHVISYSYRFLTLGGGTDFGLLQDTWLEEAMAHAAEDLIGIDFANIDRVNRFLVDPGATSLVGSMADDSIEQRGVGFLFMRYLGDRFGEGVYHDIVRTRCRGRRCIEIITGIDFRTLVEEFLATMYLSQRGLNGDPRFNLMSFDMQNDFAPLPVENRLISDGPFSNVIRTASGDYYIMGGLDTPASVLRFSAQPAPVARRGAAGEQTDTIRGIAIRIK